MCLICKAEYQDLPVILELQYLAYQSEAALFGNKDIPPLKETLDELQDQYNNGVVLKLVTDDNEIIGSVRAFQKDGIAYIGKLMVHPDHRRHGYGSRLLSEIEKYYPGMICELFTSTRSIENIRLYKKAGYEICSQKKITDELVFVYMRKHNG